MSDDEAALCSGPQHRFWGQTILFQILAPLLTDWEYEEVSKSCLSLPILNED